MSLRKKAEPAPLVVSLTAGKLKVKGTPYVFTQGELIRSDHPLVKANPKIFTPSGLTTQEYAQLRHAYRMSKTTVTA